MGQNSVAREGCYLQGLCCRSSTSFPGCSSFKDFDVGETEWHGLSWSAKNQRSLTFSKWSKCIYKVPLRNWQKRTMYKTTTSSTKIYIVTETSNSLCDFVFLPQCVETGGLYGRCDMMLRSLCIVLGLSFSRHTVHTFVWLLTWQHICFAQALEMVAKCIRQKPQLLSVELWKHSFLYWCSCPQWLQRATFSIP